MKQKRTAPVNKRSLLRRINRVLEKRDEVVRKSRGVRWWSDLGDYYQINFNRNVIIGGHVDLEALGRELGVLQAWEHLADDNE